ncbi:MAG: spore coat associated protein CotJA [Anaerovoracaceae bacterium]|nr:spore coat associated protein CotJA [Bacillota bacterium]MDY3954844.1 spore coat associated protein CotJA [Anaerovoracaceae bacterium]
MGHNTNMYSVQLSSGVPCPCSGENPCIPCDSPMDNCKLSSLPLAMAYVPFQTWNNNQYDAATGLCRGTLFPELDLPFGGRELV